MNKEDLAKHAALKSVLSKGEFKINGEAIFAVASLFAWFNNLPVTMVNKPEPVEKPKKVKNNG